MSATTNRLGLPRIAAAAALVAAVAGLGYLAWRPGGSERADPRAPAARPTPPPAAAGPTAGKNLQVSPAILTDPNSAAKPRAASIGTGAPAGPDRALTPAAREALAALRAALGAKDADALAFAEARLRTFVGGDEGRALALFEVFHAESDPAVLSVLAGVLAADPAAQGSLELGAAMAALAESADAPAARREQALAFLGQSSASVPDLDRRLAALAREGEPAWRQAALAALASRAVALGAAGGEAAQLLVRTVHAERDPGLRATFMAGLPLRDAPAPVVADVVAALREDGAPAVREAAAHALGEVPAESRPRVAAELETAFRRDDDLGTRRAILISLVRLLGPGALAPIERLRSGASVAIPDVDDYIAILRSGETQADRVFAQKVARETARGGAAGGHDHLHED